MSAEEWRGSQQLTSAEHHDIILGRDLIHGGYEKMKE